jgi:2-C-methyl-D-erythritol 2,4-cyclodiphosphate synthase
MDLLAQVVRSVTEVAAIGNVDVAVVAEAPRLAPHIDAMQRNLTQAVGAPVTVKPKRAEGLGSLGRQEGIACWATALVVPRDSG